VRAASVAPPGLDSAYTIAFPGLAKPRPGLPSIAPPELNPAADLVLVPARLGQNADESEYEELLPVSPP
jgi:hypothetical protein